MNLPLRQQQYCLHGTELQDPQTWEVGIDLGSTYSAAAFCLTSASTEHLQAGDIQQVNGYKQAIGIESGKTPRCEVPTQLRYEESGGFVRWGYEVVYMAEKGVDKTIPGYRIELFKPGLDNDERTRETRRKIEEDLSVLPFHKSVDDVVTDFLTLLLKHVKIRMAAKGYGDHDHVHLACTVPAMWSKRAKRRTLQAFNVASERSGFVFENNVSICSEPEAAAAYVFDNFRNIQLKEGDTFIVCDAGGVTMDVVTYVTMGTNPLRLKEVVGGDGAFCGSSFLNERYREQVEERLKDQTYLNAICNGKPVVKLIQSVVSHFENTIKRDYEGGEEWPWWVSVPGLAPDPEKGFDTSEMVVTKDHVEQVFKPILETCWDLIKSQLQGAYQKKREPTRILCVGGLVGSTRFRHHIEGMVAAMTTQLQRKQILCLFPPAPDFAVAAGAILRSLNKCVIEDHISRSSVAISRHEIYEPGKLAHRKAQYEFDELEGRNYVHDCVEVLLKRDDVIPSTGLRKTSHLHRTILVDEETLLLTVPIYVCDDERVADHYPIGHPKNAGCEVLEKVSFKVDVALLKERLPPKNTKNVQQYQESQQQRRSGRHRKGNPGHEIVPPVNSSDSLTAETGHEQLQRSLPSSNDVSLHEDALNLKYIWVDYKLEVEFKDMLMSYQLLCPAAGMSFEGQVNLAPILEPWVPEG